MKSLFKSSTLYYTLASIIVLVAVAYGLLQYKVMQAQSVAVQDNRSVVAALTERDTKLNNYYMRFAASQSDIQKQLTQSLDQIMPIGEQYTDLTRAFDAFFASKDSATNPIFQSSLRFGKGEAVKEMNNVGALPVTMNLEGTRENFFEFLRFINNSGRLGDGKRLIAINSIQLNFPDGGELIENERQVINFTVDMTAYYRIK